MHTSLYYKDIRGLDWDTAHIYEHLFITCFEQYLETKGFSRYIYGWINGRTYQAILFIEAAFYNPAIKKLFEEFVTTNAFVLDKNQLPTILAQVQAEEQSLFKDIDTEKLVKSITQIANLPFHNNDTLDTVTFLPDATAPTAAMHVKKSTRKFTEFKVVIHLPDTQLENVAVFLRLTPILTKIADTTVTNSGGYATTSDTSVHYNARRKSFYITATYRIAREGYDKSDMLRAITHAMQNFDIKKHASEFTKYITTFAAYPTWSTFPVEYFETAGIHTSRAKIAQLFQSETLGDVFAAIRIDIA